MLKRSTSDFSNSKLYCTISSSLIGIIIIILCLISFSVLMTKLDAPEILVSVMSSLALCIGAYFGGFISSRRRRKKGFFMGIASGVFIFCLIFLIGVIFAKNVVTFSTFSKLIMILICSSIGGIIGVNSRKKRY